MKPFTEGVSSPEAGKSPIIGNRNEPKASPSQPTSPAANKLSPTSADWPAQSDEDIDRLVAMHQNRSSLSSLGVSVNFHSLSVSLHLDHKSIEFYLKFPIHIASLASFRFNGERLLWSR